MGKNSGNQWDQWNYSDLDVFKVNPTINNEENILLQISLDKRPQTSVM